jgi:hypothetical protein
VSEQSCDTMVADYAAPIAIETLTRIAVTSVYYHAFLTELKTWAVTFVSARLNF